MARNDMGLFLENWNLLKKHEQHDRGSEGEKSNGVFGAVIENLKNRKIVAQNSTNLNLW